MKNEGESIYGKDSFNDRYLCAIDFKMIEPKTQEKKEK